MQFDRRRFIGAALAAGVAACTTRSVAPPPGRIAAPAPPPAPLPAVAAQRELPPLLGEALAALDTHRIAARDRLALVDFSLPSREPRFHLVDVAGGRIEQSWLVAHGSGSDPAHTGLLQLFSNVPGSNASSNGAFLTADPYIGQHGRSQRLIGLEASNDMAFARAIVIHGAAYVDPALIARQGRIGRSQGCFAFEQGEVANVMERLGEGRLIYAGKVA
jgi:hypothetical protein